MFLCKEGYHGKISRGEKKVKRVNYRVALRLQRIVDEISVGAPKVSLALCVYKHPPISQAPKC